MRRLNRREHHYRWDSWFDSQGIALMLIVAVLGVVLAPPCGSNCADKRKDRREPAGCPYSAAQRGSHHG
jgi:hypothetical protein